MSGGQKIMWEQKKIYDTQKRDSCWLIIFSIGQKMNTCWQKIVPVVYEYMLHWNILWCCTKIQVGVDKCDKF